VTYQAFGYRLAGSGVAMFMRGMCVRLVEQLRVQTRLRGHHDGQLAVRLAPPFDLNLHVLTARPE
jgi:hypothetical protein